MSITFLPSIQQAPGIFDRGRILERKPIGFPGEGGLKPYSCLFYWAHAWSSEGGLIAEHPHRGFEIVSYVLEGEIDHYDSQLQGWKKLRKGDAQIIRAGSGITHAEKLLPGGQMFQIWFDPGISRTLHQPASYNDYNEDIFPVSNTGAVKTVHVAGNNSPLRMDTPGIAMKHVMFEKSYTLIADTNIIVSAFIIGGTCNLNNRTLEKGDFFVARNEQQLHLSAAASCQIFIVEIPARMGYPLYIGED